MSVIPNNTVFSQPSVVGPGLGSNSTNSNSILHTNNVSAAGSLGVGGQVITNNFVTESQVLDKKRLNELVKEVDPSEQLDEDVEDVLLQIADDFIEQTVSQACALAKHRKAATIDVKDVQLVLERSWNMWIPGFGADDIRPQRRSANTEAHKQRMAVIKKALKKY